MFVSANVHFGALFVTATKTFCFVTLSVKKILIKCANVLPVLRNFFCFQAIILCQLNFLQFYKFKKPAFVTVQVFQFSVF